MKVIGVDLHNPGDGYVHAFAPVGELADVLPAADYLVINLPLTKETRGLIGRAEFSAIKRGALLINVSRGGIVDEDAMVEALKEGILGGAGCDVFQTEPLDRDSPLYELPNVIVSPHMAGLTTYMVARAMDLFCENLGRFSRREELLYRVDRKRGF